MQDVIHRWTIYRAQTPRRFNDQPIDAEIVARENTLIDVFLSDLAVLASFSGDAAQDARAEYEQRVKAWEAGYRDALVLIHEKLFELAASSPAAMEALREVAAHPDEVFPAPPASEDTP